MVFVNTFRRYLKHVSITVLLAGGLMLLPATVFATPYGSGAYSGCVYSQGCAAASSATPSSPGASSPAVPAGTILLNDYSEYFSDSGKSLDLSTSQVVYFIIVTNGQTVKHSVTVKQVGDNSVTLTLASTPFDVTILTGETHQYDVTSDGVNDIQITLASITAGKATLIFKDLLPHTVAQAPLTTTPTAPTNAKRSWWGLIISIMAIVTAVILFVILWWRRRRRREQQPGPWSTS